MDALLIELMKFLRRIDSTILLVLVMTGVYATFAIWAILTTK